MKRESANAEFDLCNSSRYSLQMNQLFLKPIGAWPMSKTTTKRERFYTFVSIVVCYIFILITIVPAFLRVILEDEPMHMKIKTFGPVGHWFFSAINYTALLLKSEDIKYCLQHMNDDWQTVTRQKDREAMRRNAQYGRLVFIICAIIVQTGNLSYCGMTTLMKQAIEIGNETRFVPMLPCAVYNKIFMADRSPMYEVMFVSQLISAIIVNTSELSFFGLSAVLTAHACGQLHVLMSWITDCVNDIENKKSKEPFKDMGLIVENHLRILGFISRIENMMNKTFFIELSRCIVAACVLGYFSITEWADGDVRNLTSYFIIFVGIAFNTFIMCSIGEILTEQCEKVGDVVFMTDWYHLPYKTILDFVLIIARSNVVVQITAGKIIHLSFHTFSDVMKSAFAYMNMIRQTI